jgi:uncharacterized membrane protein
MNKVIKEELLRSSAVFFFALIIVSFLITKFIIPASFITLFGIPLLIVLIHFIIKIYIRRNEKYKPKIIKPSKKRKIIRKELWKSAIVFFIALTIMVFLTLKSDSPISFFTIGTPLIIAILYFAIKFGIRVYEDKPKKQFRYVLNLFIIAHLVNIFFALIGISLDGFKKSTIIFFVALFVLISILFISYLLIRKYRK